MKYFVKTYGCQMNESDSERIAGFLEAKGYKPAPDMEGADLIVVNACSVRQSAIDRVFGLKQKFARLKAKKILTGCVLKSDKKKFKEFFDEIVNIGEFSKRTLFSDREKVVGKSGLVPIMTGCDNFCSYCVVPYVRGRETSRKPEEIIKEIKELINPAEQDKQSYKEITLLGQNVNSYKYDFSKLLKKLNALPGNFTINFMTNHPKDMSDELIETIAKSKKVAKEIHLPIQSGDNEILRKMNRGYTVKQYKNLIKKIKKKIPNVKISTDVIVGFPGETKKQFENSVKLFKEVKFDKAYINKYSPRPGTSAYNLKDDVSHQEKKRRWNILNDIVNKPKLIVVLGPTASGKSELAVKLAKEFNGEIISADSRQVYKEMNIGTGKITKNEMQSIPHYCLDIASPKKQITVAEHRKKALELIDKIYKKDKVPILCGGTGFYIQAIVEGLDIPEVKPDSKLRKKLENKTTEQLFNELKKLDSNRAKTIDSKNRRRLVRALEIVIKTNQTVPQMKKQPPFGVLYIGIKKNPPDLKKSINQRVDKMIKQGLEKEVKRLVKKYGWTTVLKNAIGYKEWQENPPQASHAGGQVKLHTLQFAKRQMTWFKRNKKIHWMANYQQIKKLVKDFLL